MDFRDFPIPGGADDKGSDFLGLGPACDNAQYPAPEVDVLHEGLPLRRSLPERDGVRAASDGEGLRVVGLGADSDDDDDVQIVASRGANWSGDDLGPPLPRDCLRIEEEQMGEAEEEEVVVAVDGRLDDRAVLSSMIRADGDGSVSGSRSPSSQEEEDEWSDLEYDDTLVTLIRFVLGRGEWNASNIDAESYFGDDHEEDSEHDTLFGQFVDQDRISNTPAAKSVVERLPVVVMTEEDVANKNTFCAVCKDQISSTEMARQLPCLHMYHGECILPWLEMSNTCPVCRYELPTMDPEYES